MKKIIIIGGGAMGSAFTIPCLENNNKVTITEPYSKRFIKDLSSKDKFHSALKVKLPKNLKFRKFSKELLKEKFDLIVIALSLSGIDFIGKELENLQNKVPILVLTKGLKYEKKGKKILTISEQLKNNYNISNISILKGPCLAKELARKSQTSVIVASKSIKKAKQIGKIISTNYYSTEISTDLTGVELSGAIKNIYSMLIGASEGLSNSKASKEIQSKYFLNTAASLIHRSISEMVEFVSHYGGKPETVYGLAGLGDLYVSAIGGRNSLMGKYLGEGYLYNEAKEKFMKNITIEGAQLALEIGPKILQDLNPKHFPLMFSVLQTICENKKLKISW